MAATSKSDGYTIAQIPITVFRLPYMSKATFDPAKDFTFIIGLTGYTFGVVVRKDAPWQTFEEMIQHAKANPGAITYATPGSGTSLHIGMEQIARLSGVTWTHVPFRGSAETNAGLLGGHVHAVADATGWRELVKSGEFRLLVTWGATRTHEWPDVPTLKELGIDLVANSPYGIAGPKNMDPAIVKVLHDAFAKGVREATYAEALRRYDQELAYLPTADYAKHAVQQMEEARKIVDELGLKSR